MAKVCVILIVFFSLKPLATAQSESPKPATAEFADQARKLGEQERRRVDQMPWHSEIVTTIFWIGQQHSGNNPVPNYKNSWDANWTANYGGFDTPEPSERRNYIPIAFVPQLNPFYCALPYNDVVHGQFRQEAPLVIPWFTMAFTGPGISVCQNRWVTIRKGDRTCYAQWSDCGPFVANNFHYVFGHARPQPNRHHGAGLDVSPAVRDYLGLQATDATDWRFVDVRDVSPGPWRRYGRNNHFVLARDLQFRLNDKMRPADLGFVAF